jgi:hypothetical protein
MIVLGNFEFFSIPQPTKHDGDVYEKKTRQTTRLTIHFVPLFLKKREKRG